MSATRSFSFAALIGLATVSCGEPYILAGDQPGVMTRVAGVPNQYGARLDSVATNTQLALPMGLAIGDDGTLYIADSGNARVLAVTPAGRVRLVIGADDCVQDCLVAPAAVDVEADGTLWIADAGAHRIFRLRPGAALEVIAGSGVEGSDPDGSPAREARIGRPSGIVVDEDGILYFSELSGNRVRTLDQAGLLRTIAGNGAGGYSEAQPAPNAMLDGPAGLALGGNTLYIADERNHRVRAVDLSRSMIRTVAGIGVAGYVETDTLAATARLNRPRAVAVGMDGTQLFIAEAGNNIVRLVGLGSGRVARYAGTGDVDFNGESGDAAETSLYEPSGLALHGDGMLFIADTRHQIVWRTPTRF